ncbi:hypothetical protein sos41_24760 [Alphaproteobacteria bacterium SO-S41]|nr:hypothetical protein sos41_24760 [Alphaproteobacteria bacterium SO-S41]
MLLRRISVITFGAFIAGSAAEAAMPVMAPPEGQLSEPLHTLAGPAEPSEIAAYTPDGGRLISADDDGVRVWDAATGAPIASFQEPGARIDGTAISPDGKRVVAAYNKGYAKIWDVASGKAIATLSGHTNSLLGARYSLGGARVLTWSYDGSVRIWDAETGASVAVFDGGFDLVYDAAFSPDGTLVAIASRGTASSDVSANGIVELWSVARAAWVRTLVGQSASDIRNVVFADDGATVFATGSPLRRSVKADVFRWDVASGDLKTTYAGHTDTVFTVEIAPDKTHILTGSYDGTARIFEIESGAPVTTFARHAGGVTSATYSPDGRMVLTAGTLTGEVPKDGTARLWDVASGQILRIINADPKYLETAIFAPDGQTLATAGSDGTIRIWPTAS